MGENGETTGGGGGPNPNPTEAIDEVDEVLEAQNKEWRINEFCSKLTRVGTRSIAWCAAAHNGFDQPLYLA